MRPSNTDTAACGAQLLVLPAESQPAPAAISTRDTSGWDRGSGSSPRTPTSPAPARDAPSSFDRVSSAGTDGGGAGVGDAATGEAGATGAGAGGTGGLIQISARVALSRSTALTASTAARRSGEAASSGKVCTAERPVAASVTQISALPPPKKIPN